MVEADQYSYVFGSQAGYLDHALVSPQMTLRIAGVDISHINSDEALFLHHNTSSKSDGLYQPESLPVLRPRPVLVGVTDNLGRQPR